MKRKMIAILLLCILLSAGRQSTDGPIYPETSTDVTAVAVVSRTGEPWNQNDLVYRSYSKGIKLSANSVLRISPPYLEGVEGAVIYAVNLEKGEWIEIGNYHPKQVIIYTPDSEGVYMIIAETDSGEGIDLTSKAVVETVVSQGNGGGFILLD